MITYCYLVTTSWHGCLDYCAVVAVICEQMRFYKKERAHGKTSCACMFIFTSVVVSATACIAGLLMRIFVLHKNGSKLHVNCGAVNNDGPQS